MNKTEMLEKLLKQSGYVITNQIKDGAKVCVSADKKN